MEELVDTHPSALHGAHDIHAQACIGFGEAGPTVCKASKKSGVAYVTTYSFLCKVHSLQNPHRKRIQIECPTTATVEEMTTTMAVRGPYPCLIPLERHIADSLPSFNDGAFVRAMVLENNHRAHNADRMRVMTS